MERKDLTIIWMGESYPYPNVTDVDFGRNSICFKDEKGHHHVYHAVVYHLETYFPETIQSLPENVIEWFKISQAHAWLVLSYIYSDKSNISINNGF